MLARLRSLDPSSLAKLWCCIVGLFVFANAVSYILIAAFGPHELGGEHPALGFAVLVGISLHVFGTTFLAAIVAGTLSLPILAVWRRRVPYTTRLRGVVAGLLGYGVAFLNALMLGELLFIAVLLPSHWHLSAVIGCVVIVLSVVGMIAVQASYLAFARRYILQPAPLPALLPRFWRGVSRIKPPALPARLRPLILRQLGVGLGFGVLELYLLKPHYPAIEQKIALSGGLSLFDPVVFVTVVAFSTLVLVLGAGSAIILNWRRDSVPTRFQLGVLMALGFAHAAVNAGVLIGMAFVLDLAPSAPPWAAGMMVLVGLPLLVANQAEFVDAAVIR